VFDFVPTHAHMEVSPVVDVTPAFHDVFHKDDKVYYDSRAYLKDFYVPGAIRNGFIETFGWLAVLGSLLGVVLHGTLRVFPQPLKLVRKIVGRKS